MYIHVYVIGTVTVISIRGYTVSAVTSLKPLYCTTDSSNFLSVQVATSNEITTATCSFLSEVKTDVRCRVDYGTSPDLLEYSATSQQMGSAGESVTVELTLNGAALMEDTVYYYQATLVSLECVVIEGQFTNTGLLLHLHV